MKKNIATVLAEKDVNVKHEFQQFVDVGKTVHPHVKAIKIIGAYLVFGVMWILLSDSILNYLVENDHILREIQLYKGWFYVVFTGGIFFVVIYRTLLLYKRSNDYVLLGYEELSATYEEMVALNEELDDQYRMLEKKNSEIALSNQRHQIIAEGSYDGIWDWDVVNDIYFLSDKWKLEFGYLPEEIGPDLKSWGRLFHPDDWEETERILAEYVENARGTFQTIYRVRKKSGEYRWILSRGKGVCDDKGRAVRMAGSHTDITEKKELEDKLEYLAYHEYSTGCWNRSYMEREISERMANNERMSIINFDIDNLKHVNDVYGRKAGDEYVKHFAGLLHENMPEPDIVVHLSGNQFTVAHRREEDNWKFVEFMEDLLEIIRIPWQYERELIYITVSAGVALFPEQGYDFTSVMQNAETAMFYQKSKGKDGYTFFTTALQEESIKVSQMNTELRKAIENQEFVLVYQPQYEFSTMKMIGVESLIRWKHPTKGIISPMEFIPFSEKTGHIRQISQWVFRTAVVQKRKWNAMGLPPIKVAINMSGYVIADEEAIDELCEWIEEYQIQPDEIEIEVTETAIMLDLETAKRSLERIRSYGITIALDDFGTGYSSLTYLHTLPFDVLKIDREFIRNIREKDEESFIYKTVVELAHNMKLLIVAEGVETLQQHDFLVKHHCDIGQGYYYSKPVDAVEIESILRGD